MNVLIIGGTVFLGRHLIRALQERRHEVTLFNRGIHFADDFPEIEKLRGNRDGDLSVLKDRKWDAVIDTCGYVPRIVGMSAQFLAESVNTYVFISSVSVYEDSIGDKDEQCPVIKLNDITTEIITGETYGGLKYLCEQSAEEAMPGRVLTIRPGLIVGPNDWSGRFAYWVHRALLGGEVLVPDSLEQVCQFIDVRDLAEWTVKLIENNATGIYNADGNISTKLGDVITACFNSLDSKDYTLVPISEQLLLENAVIPYQELPLWVPSEWGERTFNCDKAIKDGLRYRSLQTTITDTREWLLTVEPREKALGKSLTSSREVELLGKRRFE
ncbi:MAG: NAD-dependent epimerase/dehydratase family protein [Bacteroidetes bacterium]|nr:NAD-dependent epimerase/dehydratase family protein [Bacteroidota bacterium]